MNLKDQLKKVQAEVLASFIDQILAEKNSEDMYVVVEEGTYNIYVQPVDFKNINYKLYDELRVILEANGLAVYDDYDLMVEEVLHDRPKSVLYFGEKPIIRFPIRN